MTKRNVNFLFLFLLLILSLPVHAGRWIVENPRVRPLAMPLGMKPVHTVNFQREDFTVVEMQSVAGADERAEAKRISQAFGGARVTPDFPIELIPVPAEDPKGAAGDEAGWHTRSLRYDMLPPNADGRGITVAVVDTGLDYTHPALKNHMWVNPKEIPGNKIDDDNDGFIDNVYGIDLVTPSGDPMDNGATHGTHVAGIIAGDQLTAPGGSRGVAPGVKLMAIKIISAKKTFLSDAVMGWRYAVDHGANILSNSWRVYSSWKTYDPTEENLALLKAAIQYAQSRNVLVVVASGNERTDVDNNADKAWPVCFTGLKNLVGVASSDYKDLPSSFTNYGNRSVHVAAPGSRIVSTVRGGKWEEMSGTSMATPLVAGVLARGLSAGMSPEDAVIRLIQTSQQQAIWHGKMHAEGVIDLMKYFNINPK